ncbi:MAG: hypothetical protein K5919_07010 [Clostridiales bacterium]|nr:hypothetical protein [Clostridiales bacterium]
MDLMAVRRSLLIQESSLLPGEYQKVEYVYGSLVRINTGYVPVVSPKAVITFMIRDRNDRDILGFTENKFPSFIVDPAPGDSTWYNRYGSTSRYSPGGLTPPTDNVKQSWEFGQIVKCNGVVEKTLDEVDWSANTQAVFLFGARNSHIGLNVYDFALYDGSTLVRKMIPCRRKNDNVAGLYCTVTKTFYTSNTGTMTAGPDI